MPINNLSRVKGALLAGSCIWLAMGVARADTTDDLLAKLLAKGILTQDEYNALKQRKAAEVPAAAPAAAPATSASTPGGLGNGYVTMMDKGIGVHVGSVDVSVSGEVNGFYVYDSPQKAGPNTTVLGGLAAVGTRGNSSVRNGLLPGDFNIDLATVQDGYTVDVHFGMYPGLNSVTGAGGANSAGDPRALATSGIDFRQQYVSVGTDRLGTVKLGRDIGLFGQEAILNDFTLFGVGSTGGNVAPSNTSLGRIGLGYVYTDFMPQITYTTPNFSGFQGAVGIFQPLTAFDFSGASGQLSGHDTPMVQAKLTYTYDPGGPFKAKLWTNVVTQELKASSSAGGDVPGHGSVQGTGWDFGGKLDYGPAELIAYGYIGSALGTTGLFFDAVSPTGQSRDSDGYLFQGSYTLFNKLTLSGSYGLSHLDLASGEISPLLLKDNESYAFGAKYKLTSWVNVVGEFTHTTATAQGGNQAEEDTVAAGAIAFF
jgi:predicted porin